MSDRLRTSGVKGDRLSEGGSKVRRVRGGALCLRMCMFLFLSWRVREPERQLRHGSRKWWVGQVCVSRSLTTDNQILG